MHANFFLQIFGSPLDETAGGYASITQPIKSNNGYSRMNMSNTLLYIIHTQHYDLNEK